MSQDDVLDIIKELGGEATTTQIRVRAKEKFPIRSLYSYVNNRLRKLVKNKRVEQVGEKWKIKKSK